MRRDAAVLALMAVTVLVHIAHVTWYLDPETPAAAGAAAQLPALQPLLEALPPPPPTARSAVARPPRLLIVTATQPAPCTTQHGDYLVQLALKNKLQYATLHGYAVWASTELLSPWDLGGQWNKVALLSVLAEANSSAASGVEWLLWVDDDAIFGDVNFAFPLDQYEAAGVELVMWGDDKMTYEEGNSEGINTGIMLLRRSAWSRRLLAAWAAVASSPLRPTLSNHDQGGLVHMLHTRPALWRGPTLLERNFTMNGHWPSYVGKFVRGRTTLKAAVWGDDRIPFVLHYSGCQMCRGHSYNGTWTESGVDDCRRAFMEAFTFADDLALERVGMRHPRLGMMTARPIPGSLLQRRHAQLTRCMPNLLVVGTQKGGTSTLHYVLRSGWHKRIQLNEGEKEIHYFSLDDVYAKGASLYQQRWDGEGAALGECPTITAVRGEVSASYLDYPKAAERAAALVPTARVVALLREPVARLGSSFNMRWQIEVCGKLTWTRRDCFVAITSRGVIRENAVGPFQMAAAMKVWSKCAGRVGKGLDVGCLRADFVAKIRNRTLTEMRELDDCSRKAPSEPLSACLRLSILGQRKLYKKMEDAAYVYRSLYGEHLINWLKFFPPSQLLVVPSEALFDSATLKSTMQRFATFLGVPADGSDVNHKVLSSASPASTTSTPHENGRVYVADVPTDLNATLSSWLCPKNRLLARLLQRHSLVASLADMPWLEAALARCGPERLPAPRKSRRKQRAPELDAADAGDE